ncbi:LPD38 domain-containing protein [Phascolarctobacterium succinatutens]|uniref:LPD38 domain-containing protein n=1 Tax=Phascolarctobacterium succinatutens TaxID=626940 RepID=UPI003AAF885F
MPQGETAGNGVFGWLKDSADAGFFSTLGGTARLAGEFMPFGNDTFNSWADKADEIARRNSPQPGQNLEGADYIASAVGNALGSGGASALEAGVVAGIGSLLGVGGVAGAALGGASKVIPGVGKAVQAGKTLWGSPMGKYLVANVAGSPFEAASESGNLISDMRKENQQGTANYSDEEIRDAAIRSGALNLAWLTGMNMLEAGTLGKITGALGGDMAAKGVKNIAKRATLGGLSSGIGEGAEEYGQNLIGDYSKRGSTADFNYDEALEAAKLGAIGGGVLGGVGSGLSATFSKNNSDVAEEIASEDGGTIEEAPEATVSGKEAFINAIAGQESGGDYGAVNGRTGASGKYQIMPENWPAWAEEAGLGADAEMTPENQEIVARYKLGEYYDKYGARGAAIAWYAGEGALDYSEEALNRKQGKGDEPSINEYADSVLARMGNVADSARIDDTEENYFDESDSMGLPKLSAPTAKGFDVSHLVDEEAQDARELFGEKQDENIGKQNLGNDFFSNIKVEQDKRAKAIEDIVRAVSQQRTFDELRNSIPSNYLEQMQKARAVVPVNNNAVGRPIPLQTRAALTMQRGRNGGLNTDELAIMQKYQGNPDAFNRQFKKSVEAVRDAVNRGDITPDVGRAYMQNLGNMYNTVAGTVQNDGVILQGQDPAIIKMLGNLRDKRRRGDIGALPSLLQENGNADRSAAFANIINARAAQKFDEAETADKFKFVPQRQSMYDGAMRRNLAAQDKVKPEEQPSVEPTERNGAALDKRNMLDVTLPKVREQHKWDKEHKEYHAERYGESALPQTQLLSTDRAARRNMPKPGIEARSFINDRAEKKSARERMQDAIAFVWKDDPKHPMKSCRRQLNMFRDMRKEYLQPIYDVMAEGAGNGVSRIPIIEFDNQHRGRFYRQSNNSPWYAKYFKEHKKKPTQKAMYDIAEEVAFGENADVGYYAGVQGKELEAIVAENHAQLDPINDYIQTYESLELRLKENPNYGKEQAERINKAEEARRAEKRNAGETASAESIKTEAKQPAESNQDEVNKKAVSKNASGIDKAKVQEVLEAISDTEVFDGLAEPTNINKMIVGKSKEELYKIAIDNIKSKLGKIFTDPLGNKIYFAPGNTESIEDYALHLIAGMGKLVEDIRVQRVLGVLLSDKTIQKPWAIIRQANGRKMYLSVYRGANSMTNGLIIGVEEGQDGRVVTSMLTANKKGDKKAALREFKKHVSGADKVLYIWEGLTGHSRPSSDQQASTANASLDPSGNQSIAQPAENVKKLNLPKGTTVDVSIVGDNSNIIQVKFNGAQGKGTGGIMGRAGYIWKSDKQVWQARKTDKAMDIAEQLGYKPAEPPKHKSFFKKSLEKSNERVTKDLIAQNKDESVPGKKYTKRNKFFSVSVLDGVIRVKDARKINPQDNQFNFSLSVEEYQRAAQDGNRRAGIRKLLKAKSREGLENWIEESTNERTKEVRKQTYDEAMFEQTTDQHYEVAYPLIESALQKAGIEALDHQSLFERAKGEKPSADIFSQNPDALINNEEMSEDKNQQIDKYKNYSKEDIKTNKERLATMPDVDGILQPAAKKFAEFFKAHFPKSDYTYETVDFWNNYILEFEQLNKILKKYRQATQQGDLSAADAYFQQISSSLDRLNNLLGKLVGKDKEEQQAQMRQEFRDSIIPFFDEYNKIADKHNAKEDAKKASKAKKQQNQGKQGYKYYLNARPADVGTVPKGFIRIDTEDKGGRYGAIYYDRQLSDKEAQQYELKSDADVAKGKAQTEAVKQVSRELMKSEKVAAQAKNNSLEDFTLAYYDAIENYLADHIEENPIYEDLLNDPTIIDKIIETESIIQNTYEKLREKTSIEGITDNTRNNNKTADKQKRFDKERANKTLASIFGQKNKAREPKPNDVGKKFVNVFDESKADELIERIKNKLNRLNANPIFDPELMSDIFHLGGIYLQQGVNKFAHWSKLMVGALGESVRPFLTSAWNSVNKFPAEQEFNADAMQAVMERVGNDFDEGKSLQQIKKDLVEEFGDEVADYVDAAYEGVKAFPTSNTADNMVQSKQDKGGSQYDSNSTKQLSQNDTRSGNTGNEVRRTAEGERSSAGNGQRSETTGEQGGPDSDNSVSGSRTSAGGKTSVRTGSQEASATDSDASGSTGLSDSVVDSLQGKPDVEGRTTGDVVESAKDGRVNAADTVTAKVDKVIKENSLNSKRASRLRKTAKAMPFLSTIQLSNSDFVADRLADNGKQGVMITDGTGTGKTFSGLAIAKEMVEDGKENILIVTPSDSVNNQWANAAKDFFGIELSKLDNIQDAGKGAVITTYANLGANDALIKRDWDLVICDESHYLMNNEQGEKTAALAKLRQLTLHPRELRARAEERILPEKKLEARRTIAQAAKLKRKKGQLKASEEAIVEKAEKLKKEKADELSKEERVQVEAQVKDWEQLNTTEKPKVMFMSATPFAYVPDIDYAEGYLFDYPKVEGGSYNQPGNGFQQFMIEHFGYHMRYNKLTKPDKAVDNAVMEVEFHEWLRKTGALTGHELEIDKDYNRGFLLVDQGVGKKIDEGFEFLRNNHDKYRELEGVLNKQFDSRRRNYLLESIKARESVPIIQQYLKAGKKVVVFYETNVERESFNPFKFTQQTKELLQSGENRWTSEEIQHEMDMFAKERPDLVNLNLDELSEPISIYREAFGDDAMFFNGRVSKNKRAEYVKAFNDDNSDKNLIFVQQDAGNAGISLHDTTGKHQRVLINIGIPRRPSYAIQIEGRIYRLGNKSNAIIRYLTTATNIENGLFAETVAGRASTAENLALGRRARGLRDSFKNAYQEIFDGTWEDRSPGMEGEDVGGKENDRNIVSTDSDYDRAKAFYFARGKKTAKNKAAEGVDYFATPEPVGYKMVQWAGLKDGDRVLEPSAGHGAISRFFSPNTDNTIIEPSSRLAPQAQMNTDNAKLINGYFEDLHIGNKYDAVTMNPPFGTGGKTAVEHVAKAFKHLRNGGRVIAIIPRGAMADKRFDAWYESDDAKDAHMVGEVLLPGITFERAGTKVATRIVIIDKGGEARGIKRIDLSSVTDINELFNQLENIEMPERHSSSIVGRTMSAIESTRESNSDEAGTHEKLVSAGTYKHTKTGELIPYATLKKSLSNEEYAKAKKIASSNNGFYSKFAKGFLFKTEEDRDAFVNELNKSSEQTSNTQYSVSEEASTRSREEVETEIKKALPGAELEQREDGSYIATMPNGKRLGIVIEEQILLNERQAEKAGEAHNRAASEAEGYWSRWEQLDSKNIDGVIRVSRNSRVGTAFHETLHAAMDLCLTDKEKAALYKAFAKKAKESGRSVDEEIADAYKEWAIKRQSGQGSMFGKLFQKAKDFLNKLYTMFVETDNKGNIFRKLESGEAWKQQTYNASEAPKFNITSADIKKFINAALKNPAKHLRMVLGKVSNAEAEAIKKATGMDVQNFTHVWFSEDVRHIKNRHGVGNEKDKRQIGLTQEDIEKAIDVIKSPDRIEKGTTDKGRESIRFMKANSNGEYTVVEVVSNDKKQLAIKTMWNKKEAATTKRHADEISPQYTSETGSGNTASVSDTVSPNSQEVKYSVAPAQHKIANAFTNTERKGTIETAKDFIKEGFKDFRAHWLDKNDNLRKFDEITQMTGEMSLHQNVQNIPATAAGLLKSVCEGDAQSIKAANKHLKNVKMKHNVTLAMALNEINKDVMDKAHPKYLEANGFDSWQNAFGAYLGVERELEMSSIAKAQGETYKFSKGLTEAECRNFVENAPVQFRKAADMFYKVNDNVISIMEDAQVFSHDVAKALRTKHRKYCPLLRDFSDTAAADNFIGGLSAGGRGVGNVSIPLKAISIKGSERGVLNPLETVLKSYAMMINRAERNKVGLLAVKAAQTKQLHDLIKEVPEVVGKDGKVVNAVADPKNCIFTVLVNGKKKAYQTTQELYSPIVGYNLPAAGLTLEVARMTAQMLRTGATMSPSFIIRNLLRDTITAGFSSKNGFIPFVDTWRGFMALKNDPVLRAEFEAAGVGEFNFYGAKAQRIKSLDKMIGEHENLFQRIFGKMEEWSDIAESATRMGEFMLARKAGKSLEQAGHEAREVTVDFSKSGIYGEQINRYIPFFNACLQGGDKIYQLMREDPHGTMMKMFLTIVLPSALLYAFNRDEDWWKDLDPDIKNNYWCLSDKLRIPKPQEIGVLLGSGIEAFFEQASGRDKKAVSNVLDAFLDNMTPSIIPTLILPLVEWKTNYSYFRGQQLVSSKYQRLPDELQYNDYTSELSKGIGNVFKVSPMKVDNLVRGYTGTMGALLWATPDYAFDKTLNQPTKHWYERQFFRDFTVTDANLSRPMNEFYGILDKANRQHAGYGVKGKPEAAVKGIRSAGSMISKIRKDIDKITHSNLTPERKRELIDKRKEKMNQIAKQANARYGKYFD